jgi:hypothetical protein
VPFDSVSFDLTAEHPFVQVEVSQATGLFREPLDLHFELEAQLHPSDDGTNLGILLRDDAVDPDSLDPARESWLDPSVGDDAAQQWLFDVAYEDGDDEPFVVVFGLLEGRATSVQALLTGTPDCEEGCGGKRFGFEMTEL